MSKELRQAFVDVCNGYSCAEYNGGTLYIRHLSHKEHLYLDELYDQFKQEAYSSGIMTEKEKVDFLLKEGLWSEKKENEIVMKKDYVVRLKESLKLIKLPSILKKQIEETEKQENELRLLEKEKSDLIGMTSESYADKVVNDYYILKSFFKEDTLKNALFSKEEFDEIEDTIFIDLLAIYGKSLDRCADLNLKKLAIQDFFTAYYNLCEDNASIFFGKSIVNFTYNQVKLSNYGKFFKSILQEVDIKALPSNISKDPDQLVNYLNSSRNAKELVNNNNHSNVAIVGATKEDLNIIDGDGKKGLPNKPMSMMEMFKMQNS